MKAREAGILLFLIFLVAFPLHVVGEEEDTEESAIKHPKKNVLERKLVLDKANAKTILKENKNYAIATDKKNFQGATLAYVTPWNNHGYDLAKIFNNKFTYVSPVWIQIKLAEKITLGGLHDIDAGWIAEVRANSATKIVPRFLFEGIQNEQVLQYVYFKLDEIKQLIVDVCVQHKFDGVVLEGLAGMFSQGGDEAKAFISELARALHAENKEVILVIPPDSRTFGAEAFATYSNFIDRFSLMTYDYSSFEAPGPIAPLPWVEQAAQALQAGSASHKVMLGLNFYGFDFIPAEKTGNAIIGESYLQLLKKYNPKIPWDATQAEHSFVYKEKGKTHLVCYPTLKSVHERIKLAESMGLSIAIWEIGQGLDYFYDLL